MTTGYADMLRKQGVHVSTPRTIPIEFIAFRLHPCPHWPGVARYRSRIRNGDPIDPVVLCKTCMVILDGWHRVAAYWLEQQATVPVALADRHWMNGKECCRVDLTHWIETLRPWEDLDCISGAYLAADYLFQLPQRRAGSGVIGNNERVRG